MAAKKGAMKQPVSKGAAAAVANFLKKGGKPAAAKPAAAAPMDAEDKIDGGVDEAEE